MNENISVLSFHNYRPRLPADGRKVLTQGLNIRHEEGSRECLGMGTACGMGVSVHRPRLGKECGSRG